MEQRDLQILNDKEPKKSSKKASLKLKKPSKLKTVRNTAQGDEELLKAENPMPAENSLSQALALQEEPAQEAPHKEPQLEEILLEEPPHEEPQLEEIPLEELPHEEPKLEEIPLKKLPLPNRLLKSNKKPITTRITP